MNYTKFRNSVIEIKLLYAKFYAYSFNINKRGRYILNALEVKLRILLSFY